MSRRLSQATSGNTGAIYASAATVDIAVPLPAFAALRQAKPIASGAPGARSRAPGYRSTSLSAVGCPWGHAPQTPDTHHAAPRGWVHTSPSAGWPDLTASTARLIAGPSSFGSLIGPVDHQPMELASLAYSMSGFSIAVPIGLRSLPRFATR